MILQAVMTLTRGIALDCSCRDNPHIHDAALVIRVRLRQHAVYRLLHQRAAIVGGDDDANAHTVGIPFKDNRLECVCTLAHA